VASHRLITGPRRRLHIGAVVGRQSMDGAPPAAPIAARDSGSDTRRLGVRCTAESSRYYRYET
ncbi:MAG: hypothetical protein P8J30_08320, partial [Ilumatobacter sp.]|nr:hypothetical protein [Ilumatobacter sp.]